ncbi:phosphotransferase family protein [Streptosporangium amethystogenes]|uniref:phosphotransferase family protein n=1 Tax=Streptosporangium amethystogenes TaxID=2002 RepID=UPI0005661D61|nr:phosphotransferase [Streptosporangium amethystogenes]
MSPASYDHPPLGATAIRPSWEELPRNLRNSITAHLGSAVVTADVQGGGFTPGVAARLGLANDDRVFIKAIPDDHVLSGKYLTEAATSADLPATAPTPRLRWYDASAGWIVLIFEDLDGRHPDLSPGSADVPAVVTAVSGLVELLTPSPLSDLPSASTTRVSLLHGWRELVTCPPADLGGWERRHLCDLSELETHWAQHADGSTLIHGDIRPDNMIATAGEVVFVVDWAQPSRGAAWQDIADLVPHMIMAGHSPVSAEKTLIGVPAWDFALPEVITSYAASFAGYWTRMSRQPAPPGVPNLRGYQRRAAAAAIAWTMYRTGW